jgi:uncharacterized protein DUF4386
MPPTQNPGRFIGLIYLLVSIPGAIALVYVPSKLIVHGNAAATAANIVASETLFRFGIASELVCQVLFMWVVFLLFDLLKSVNQRQASVMLALFVISVPIALLNELNSVAALLLVRSADFLSVVDKPQREAFAMLFLNLHGEGLGIAAIFWGLWLLPLGLLVYRSGFFPSILGILLIANCAYYVATSLTSLALPQYDKLVSRWMMPTQFGELIFMFWLLIMGAKPKSPADP